MAQIFAGSEIVEIGIQIEKNGRDFYNVLAGRTRDKKVLDIFKYLAGEEQKHIEAFGKILESAQKYEPVQAYPGEYFAYMKALSEDYVFTKKNKGDEIAKNTKSDKDAVVLAIGFEKDSIVFYEGMKKVTPEHYHKLLEELLSQERAHLMQLLGLKKEVG